MSGVVETDTELGVEPVPANKWIELYDSDAGSEAINNTEKVSANDVRAHNFTLESDVTVTYSAKNAWSVDAVAYQAASRIQPFLQSYLDDGDNPAVDGNPVGAKFTVTGIPFESYDVIIYFASDKTFAVGSDNGFLPVTVNGTVYSWTQWQSETDSGYLVSDADSTAVFGSAPENAAILGKNAIRIPALSGDLSVVGAVGDGQTSKRCSIAAFQIVEAKPSININFAQTAADPYDVPASGAYGLEQEPGAAWQNIYGSSGTDVWICVCSSMMSLMSVKNCSFAYLSASSFAFCAFSFSLIVLNAALSDVLIFVRMSVCALSVKLLNCSLSPKALRTAASFSL